MSEPHGRVLQSWPPILRADGDPHSRGHLIGQPVERQCRGQADDTFGNKFGSLRWGVVRSHRRIGQLIQATGEARNSPTFFETRNRCGGHPRSAEFG